MGSGWQEYLQVVVELDVFVSSLSKRRRGVDLGVCDVGVLWPTMWVDSMDWAD